MRFNHEEGYSAAWVDLAMNLMVVFLILFFIAYASEQRTINANLVLTTDIEALRSQNTGLQGQLQDVRGENEHLKGDNDELNDKLARYTPQLVKLLDIVKELKPKVEKYEQLSKQLIGLTGEFKNVVWVVDCSGSIQQTQQLNNYFEEVNLQISTLKYEQLQIITFYGVDDDPDSKIVTQWKPSWQPATDTNKTEAVKYISQHPAAGSTPTKAALDKALSLPGVDTIVFFSDGQPTDGKRDEILAFVRQKNTNNVAINCIAFGNYFEQEYGPFLNDLADQNGGEFIGR